MVSSNSNKEVHLYNWFYQLDEDDFIKRLNLYKYFTAKSLQTNATKKFF